MLALIVSALFGNNVLQDTNGNYNRVEYDVKVDTDSVGFTL